MPSSPASEAERAAQAAVSEDGGEQASAQEAPREEADQRYAQLEDRYKRALADLDNYRKRSAAEVQRQVAERTERMARDWLEVVDSIDRATRMDVAPENPMAEGLRRVLEQIEALLDRYGIERIDAIGEPFDPERHEAVGVRESEEAPPNTVVDVARSGYTIGDRLLRPAQVIVARRPATEG